MPSGLTLDSVLPGSATGASLLEQLGLTVQAGGSGRPLAGATTTHPTPQQVFEGITLFYEQLMLNFLVTTESDLLGEIMPLEYTEAMSVQANSVRLERAVLAPLADEAAPRTVMVTPLSRSGELVKYGLRLVVNLESVRTPEGMRDLAARAFGSEQIIEDNMALNAAFEIFSVGLEGLGRTELFGSPEMLMRRAAQAARCTGVLHHGQDKFVLELARFVTVMEARGFRGNLALLMPPEMMLYLSPANAKMGSAGTFDAGAAARRMRIGSKRPERYIGDVRAYELPPLPIGERRGASTSVVMSQIASRDTFSALYYTMFAPNLATASKGPGCSDRYCSDLRDIAMFNCDSRKMEIVSFKEAALASGALMEKSPEDAVLANGASWPYSAHAIGGDVKDRQVPLSWYSDLTDTGVHVTKKAEIAGQFDPNVADVEHFAWAARALIDQVATSIGITPLVAQRDLVELMETLRAVSVTAQFVADLVKENEPYNNEYTTSPVVYDEGMKAYSSPMNVPQMDIHVIPAHKPAYGSNIAPPLMANWAGIRLLADLADDPSRGWSQTTTAKAARVYRFWSAVYDALVRADAKNVLVTQDARASWQVNSPEGVVVFENVVDTGVPVFFDVKDTRIGTDDLALSLEEIYRPGEDLVSVKAKLTAMSGATAAITPGRPVDRGVVAAQLFNNATLPYYLAVTSILAPDDNVRGAFVSRVAGLSSGEAQKFVLSVYYAATSSVDLVPPPDTAFEQAKAFITRNARRNPPAEMLAKVDPVKDAVMTATHVGDITGEAAETRSQRFWRSPLTASPAQARKIGDGYAGVHLANAATGYSTAIASRTPDASSGMPFLGSGFIRHTPDTLSAARFVKHSLLEQGSSSSLLIGAGFARGLDGDAQRRELVLDTQLGRGYRQLTARNVTKKTEAFAAKIQNHVVRAVATLLLGLDVRDNSIIGSLCDANIPLFFLNLLLFRPALALRMDSVALLRPGPELGNNFFGRPASAWNQVANYLTAHGVYVFRHLAIVNNPDAVIVMPNVRIREYIGGGGLGLFDKDRDSFEGTLLGTDANRPALIPVAVPATFNRAPAALPIAGVLSLAEGSDAELGQMYPGAMYENMFGWRGLPFYTEHGVAQDVYDQTNAGLQQVAELGSFTSKVADRGFIKPEIGQAWISEDPSLAPILDSQATYYASNLERLESMKIPE